ncbi:hypothetical protein Scep_022541 [Stephania cephalantha]|uniref:Uncharacterized protein n=1 Tax=Stephania cephalantha TaxID=152367 RepID=A0AAP0F886_9MAGN
MKIQLFFVLFLVFAAMSSYEVHGCHDCPYCKYGCTPYGVNKEIFCCDPGGKVLNKAIKTQEKPTINGLIN